MNNNIWIRTHNAMRLAAENQVRESMTFKLREELWELIRGEFPADLPDVVPQYLTEKDFE